MSLRICDRFTDEINAKLDGKFIQKHKLYGHTVHTEAANIVNI